MPIINQLWAWYLNKHMRQIDYFIRHSEEVQAQQLQQLLEKTKNTEWGKKFDYKSIRTPQQLADRVPVQDYETVKNYIARMMHGERDVLWPGQIRKFAKSSGTTSDKSKYIPVTPENLKDCHVRGGWHLLTLLYQNRPHTTIFGGRNTVIGGSAIDFPEFPQSRVGDVSAIILEQIPWVAKMAHSPGMDIALMADFEAKLEKIARITIQKDVRMIAGTPTWIVVLFQRILELTGKQHMLEVWENFQVYIHGAVSFTPYRERFRQFIPTDDFAYQETYNASEGYFAIQSDFSKDDMLLLLDNGVYYEFLPMEEWDKEFPKAIGLHEVETGKNYALVVSTNSGLWRYKIGDTVMFTSTHPYKLKITGRTKQFINAFGEEVMVANTDKALQMTCSELNTVVKEYTVAPVFFEKGEDKGGHEWIIEFEKSPHSMDVFAECLDQNLQKVNSDYEAKRFNNLALERLRLHAAPQGTFYEWMKSRGKLGAQQKVPRLSNSRDYVEGILSMIKTNGLSGRQD